MSNKTPPYQMEYKDGFHKFSTKPPGYEAARLRENQRRHRARVKSRITDLEATLEATQNRLEDALKRIEELTAEVHQLQGTTDPSHPDSTRQTARSDPAPSSTSTCSNKPSCQVDETTHVSPEAIYNTGNDTIAILQTQPPTPPPIDDAQTIQTIDINTSLQQRSDSQPDAGADPTDDCALLPPPVPGESTIRCREAYSMIKDRIMPEFDPELVNEWLKPGFRRATCPGDGCRVQTHILFALVDHITSG